MSRTQTKLCNRMFMPLVAPGLLALSAMLGVVHAHQVSLDGDIEVGDGYVATGDGIAVRTGDGDCLLGSSYSAEENGVDACRGIEEKVAEPEPEPEPEPLINHNECPICYTREKNTVVIPCGHLCCNECLDILNRNNSHCHLCRGPITSSVRMIH